MSKLKEMINKSKENEKSQLNNFVNLYIILNYNF